MDENIHRLFLIFIHNNIIFEKNAHMNFFDRRKGVEIDTYNFLTEIFQVIKLCIRSFTVWQIILKTTLNDQIWKYVTVNIFLYYLSLIFLIFYQSLIFYIEFKNSVYNNVLHQWIWFFFKLIFWIFLFK